MFHHQLEIFKKKPIKCEHPVQVVKSSYWRFLLKEQRSGYSSAVKMRSVEKCVHVRQDGVSDSQGFARRVLKRLVLVRGRVFALIKKANHQQNPRLSESPVSNPKAYHVVIRIVIPF